MASDAQPPAPLRASDAERERAVDVLRRAAGDGRLTLEELAERVEGALAAKTRQALERLTADLPAPAPAADSRRPGTRWIVGIMGGGDRNGPRRVPSAASAHTLLG